MYSTTNRPITNSAQAADLFGVPVGDDGLDWLRARGISDETIQSFSISPHGHGCYFPVTGFPNIQLWKNADSNGDPKYIMRGLPTAAHIYHAPRLALAVEAAEGHAWLTSGQPDLWTLHTVGIRNSFCFYMENRIPPADLLIAFLTSIGIQVLHYAADCDRTGLEVAVRLSDMLTGSGVMLMLHQLPGNAGSKYDLNRLWSDCSFDAGLFRQQLAALPPLSVPAPAERHAPAKRQSPNRTPRPSSHLAERHAPAEQTEPVLPEIAEAIERALVAHGLKPEYGEDGWSRRAFHSVEPGKHAHGDRRASMTFNPNLVIAKNHATGEVLNARRLCDLLKIPWPVHPPTAFSQLPTSARETLIQHGETRTAQVLDGLYIAGWEPDRVFTAAEATDALAASGVGYRSIYRALGYLGELVRIESRSGELPNSGRGNFCQKCTPDSSSPTTVPAHSVKNSGKKSGAGRKAKQYRLPGPVEVCEWLGVEPHGNDYLDGHYLKKAGLYRAGLHRALIQNRPGQYTRRFLGERFGRGNRVTRQWEVRYAENGLGDIQVTPNLDVKEMLTPARIGELPIDKEDSTRWLYIESPARRYYPTQSGARRALADGPSYLVRRGPNRYAIDESRAAIAPHKSNCDPTPAAIRAGALSQQPIYRYCAVCGQSIVDMGIGLPDRCDFCQDMTTWLDHPPRGRYSKQKASGDMLAGARDTEPTPTQLYQERTQTNDTRLATSTAGHGDTSGR